jgi:PiT family inorganic phosphate transporter
MMTATLTKFPVSSTHVITSSILGVGSAKRFSSVKWGVAGKIVVSWIITIPISMVVAAGVYQVIKLIFL